MWLFLRMWSVVERVLAMPNVVKFQHSIAEWRSDCVTWWSDTANNSCRRSRHSHRSFDDCYPQTRWWCLLIFATEIARKRVDRWSSASAGWRLNISRSLGQMLFENVVLGYRLQWLLRYSNMALCSEQIPCCCRLYVECPLINPVVFVAWEI